MVLRDRGNPNEWKELKIEQRIEFANATLNKLIWKPNPQLRSRAKKYGAEAKRRKGLELYDRCIKGIKEMAGSTNITVYYEGCVARWEQDNAFRKRRIMASAKKI